MVKALIVFTSRGSKACANPGSDWSSSRKDAPDIDAIMQLVRASTLAEREPPSIAGNSPKISPADNSRKLTALPTEE